MKRIILLVLVATTAYYADAQKYFTKNGSISFFSKTALEDIKADNNQVMAVINTQSGELQFSLLTKGFHFKKALMEEHFNADYMESDKFPKATFKGNITDLSKVDFTKDGTYPVTVSGDLTIHGVTKKQTASSSVTVKNGQITGTSKFMVTVADYNISIPKVYQDNIAKTVEVTVACNFDQKM
ncbi:YceI family protein [Ferruginibacter sp.]